MAREWKKEKVEDHVRVPRGPQGPRRSYNRKVVHGTVQGYGYWKCRCELCRQANRDYYGTKFSMEEYKAQFPLVHGTEKGYQRGCRCDECRSASTKARQRRRKAQKEREDA